MSEFPCETEFILISSDERFVGLWFGDRVNSWPAPWFDRETAEKIAEVEGGKFDPALNAFVFYDGGMTQQFFSKEIDGKTMWSIGGGFWPWLTVEEWEG